MNMSELSKQCDEVVARKDLARFIAILRKDFRESKKAWRNRDLDSYLEAMSAWIDDMDALYSNTGRELPKQPTWKNVAEMLIAPRVYE